MLNPLLFLIELVALFLLSRSLTNSLFGFFYRVTRSKRFSIYLLSFLFLPGTFIHEMAHAMMAIILQVHVGKMEFIPKLNGNNLKLGSVEIGHTDPIRRILIGISPFLIGTSLIIGVFFFAVKNQFLDNGFYLIMISYIVFEIGNTMFSSKKDLEGVIEVIFAIFFIFISCYLVGFRFPSLDPDLFFSNILIAQTFQRASLFMLAPLGINLFLVLFFKITKL